MAGWLTKRLEEKKKTATVKEPSMSEQSGRRQVNFRLSEDEEAKVKRAAEAAGLSVSAYAKKLAVTTKVKPMLIDREQGRQLIAALGKMGSNLKQIAKVANQGGGVDAAALSRLQKSIDAFWAYILDGKKPQRESETRRSASNSAVSIDAQQAENLHGKTMKAPICKTCGGEMRLYHGKKDGGVFWGCPNFFDGRNHPIVDAECHKLTQIPPLRDDGKEEFSRTLIDEEAMMFLGATSERRSAPIQTIKKKDGTPFAGFNGGRKKKELTSEEKARILAMRKEGKNVNIIARELHISNRIISEFVKNN